MKNSLLSIISAGLVLCIQQVTTGPVEPKGYINIPACALVRTTTTPHDQGHTSQFPKAVLQAKRENARLKRQAARLKYEQSLQKYGIMPYRDNSNFNLGKYSRRPQASYDYYF